MCRLIEGLAEVCGAVLEVLGHLVKHDLVHHALFLALEEVVRRGDMVVLVHSKAPGWTNCRPVPKKLQGFELSPPHKQLYI